MFKDSVGCKIVGMGYESKHNRFYLTLVQKNNNFEFRTEFTKVAAYNANQKILGEVISGVEKVSPISLIEFDWDRIIKADMAGIWPGSPPTNPLDAANFITKIKLNGYKFIVQNNEFGWVLGYDYNLLGRKTRA